MKTKFKRFLSVNSGPLSTVLKNLTLSLWKCKEQPYSHNRLFQWWHGSALSLVWLWTWICTSIHVRVPVLPPLQSVPCPHSWSWCSCQSSLWCLTETGWWLMQPWYLEDSPWPASQKKKQGTTTFSADEESERVSGTNTAKPPSNILVVTSSPLSSSGGCTVRTHYPVTSVT